MWREHDANLALIWRRDDVVGRPVVVPDALVLPDIVSLTAASLAFLPPSASSSRSIDLADSGEAARTG